jgi:hypothetical protein
MEGPTQKITTKVQERTKKGEDENNDEYGSPDEPSENNNDTGM